MRVVSVLIGSFSALMLSSCDIEATRENNPGDLAKGDSCIAIFYGLLEGERYDSLRRVLGGSVPKEDLIAHLQLSRNRLGAIREVAVEEHFSVVRTTNGVEQSIDIRSKVRVVRDSGTTIDEIYLLGPDFPRWKVTGYSLNLQPRSHTQ